MLQNEPQTEPVTLQGQARITPEELSRAVAAIERRQEAEARRLAGTIAIDEAVAQLHLDATPEDIWREVQSQREAEAARQAAIQAETAHKRSPRAQTNSPQVQPKVSPRGRRRSWPGFFIPIAVFWVIFHSSGLLSHPRHDARPIPPALTATASRIPDGTQFYCDNSGLAEISEGTPLSQVHVSTAQQFDNSWVLLKMGGHVYLRAYTRPLDSVQTIKGQPLVLYNDDNSGSLEGRKTAQTTVRVDKISLAISGGDDDYTQITVPNFHPDQFTTTSEWK
jgi:hypothetical protein